MRPYFAPAGHSGPPHIHHTRVALPAARAGITCIARTHFRPTPPHLAHTWGGEARPLDTHTPLAARAGSWGASGGQHTVAFHAADLACGADIGAWPGRAVLIGGAGAVGHSRGRRWRGCARVCLLGLLPGTHHTHVRYCCRCCWTGRPARFAHLGRSRSNLRPTQHACL